MAKLLAALGLPLPPRRAAGPGVGLAPAPAATAASSASSTPTNLKMRPDDAPVPGAGKPYDLRLPGLDLPPPHYDGGDGTGKKPDNDLKLPADPKKQIDLLADAIARTQDAAKRDKLVRALRDALAKIQPVMSDQEAKKQIDKAIDSLIASGSKKLLLDLLTAIVGKGPSTQPDPDQPHPVGPNVKEKDLGEHIFKLPEIPIGKPPAVHHNAFEFRSLPKTAKPGVSIGFKLVTPDWFDPGKTPGSWVMLMTPDDHAQNKLGGNDTDVHIDAKGTLDLRMRMPDAPGSYVIVIKIQSAFENYPVESIEISK